VLEPGQAVLLDAAIQQLPSRPSTQAAPSVADHLTQLGQLVQQGLISQEEFAAAKAKTLGQ
jgi:hypothetical protein